MRIRLAEKNDQPAWDEYVLKHERSGPYHLFAWRQAVEKAYHHSPRYLIAENEAGTIEGILPLILVRPPFFQGHLVSLPFCDYGGPLADNIDIALLLVQRAEELAKGARSKFEIRCKTSEPYIQSFTSHGPSTHKSRMLLDLPESSTILWSSFKSKLRSQIRRPQKDGMTFKLGAMSYVNDFYHVFARNMKELGSPVHARSWITSVVDTYQERAHIGIVYKGTTPVAAGIILNDRHTVTLPWASALSEYSRSSPNMLLYWGLLQYASDNGFKQFDFGRSTPGEGTYVFKEQWGARPSTLYWYETGMDTAQNSLNRAGGLRDLGEKVWSMLPSMIANSLGPVIRGYITL